MIKNVLEIVDREIYRVDILDGARRIKNIFYEKNIECSAVYDNDKLVGVLTQKDLSIAHPNRIIADVMTDRYICTDTNTHIWKVKEIYDSNSEIDVIFVKEKNDIVGQVTRAGIEMEIGKHIDLLTGLYKNDYIFHKAYDFIESGQSVTLMFIDLNNFGSIDKKYGHILGDLVLKGVGQVVKNNYNSDVFVCRYAGDEFAILTPYGINQCKEFAEKLNKDINEYAFPNDIPVTASIGITACKLKDKIFDNIVEVVKQLVNTASLASTKAKRSLDTSIVVEKLDMDGLIIE